MEEAEVLDGYSEHELRHLIEGDNSNIISSYYEDENYWEVLIDQGDYMFSGQISPKGIPTEGVIVHKNEAITFDKNEKLSPKGFAHTIMCIFQDKINEKLQHAYEEEEEEEEEEMHYNRFEVNRKAKRQRTTAAYQNKYGAIQEQERESDSEEEGNVIYKNTINEEPIKPTQQPQNQSNLNLKSSQSQKFGLGKNK